MSPVYSGVDYTKWDHFRWSYSCRGERSAEQVTPDECQYRAWFTGGLTRQPESFRTECLSTANLLHERARQQQTPMRLMLSGGADSEVMAWSFKLAGIPVSLTFLEFEDDLNHHERAVVDMISHDLGQKVDIVRVDINKIVKWAEQEEYSGFQAPISYAHRYLARMFPHEFAVWGCGDVVMVRDRHGQSYAQFGAARHPCYDIYTGVNEYLGVEQFFLYTPEHAVSQYEHPIIRAWVDSPISMPWNSYGMKIAMYKTEFPEIRTDRTKKTGAELIRKLETDFVNARQHLAPYCVRPLVKYQTVLAQLHLDSVISSE